jgi:hypothetical protein
VSGAPTALVVMAPLRAGCEGTALAALASMPDGPASPFARVGSTHFCRFLLVAALLDGDGEPAEPGRAYMLFMADFDGSLAEWAAAVAGEIGSDVDRVLELCEGYPGSRERRAFLEFIEEHRVPVGFSVRSHAASVAQVRESLRLRRAIREFAVASQGLAPSELRSAWRERFGA